MRDIGGWVSGAGEENQKGEAIFLKPEKDLWTMRVASQKAVRQNETARAFVVKDQDVYYQGMLDELLADGRLLERTAEEMGELIQGEENGALRCAALWESGSRRGVLLHREKGALRMATLPPVEPEEVQRVDEVSRKLRELADEAGKLLVSFRYPVPTGECRLSEVLQALAQAQKT